MYDIMELIGRAILVLIVLAVGIALVDAWRIAASYRRRSRADRYFKEWIERHRRKQSR